MLNHSLEDLSPSQWVVRHSKYIKNKGNVLDLACGTGRHTRYLLSLGHHVTAIDIDISKMKNINTYNSLDKIQYNLEKSSWPLQDRIFDGVIVTNYLHRPIIPFILESLATNGTLIYETFAVGNESYGKPKNPDYLLKRGELLDICHKKLSIVAYEDIVVKKPKQAVLQRICAIRKST
ncbi:MAG: SAM-dependent methyltransferase [Rhodospirillaceae bacterium]|nr:SAM-dependent methyltransferase [Rhodospirillaceae bacterium]|tara:strand:+ start:724 stop:1257 length:534 start_codon:yes stop_codon:yes gene_type:complete